MAPPVERIHASDLPIRIQTDEDGKKRKLKPGQKTIDLNLCPLFSMFQYQCEVSKPQTKDAPVRCFAVERTFRRCEDKKGTFMVETTSWDRDYNPAVVAQKAPEDAAQTWWASGRTPSTGM